MKKKKSTPASQQSLPEKKLTVEIQNALRSENGGDDAFSWASSSSTMSRELYPRLRKVMEWVAAKEGASSSTSPDTKPLPDHTLFLLKLYGTARPRYNYNEDGPQKWILDSLEGDERLDAEQRFEKAKLASRHVCLQLTGEFLFGRRWMEESTQMADNFLLTMVRAGLEHGIKIPDSRGRLCDPDFLKRVIAEQRNWKDKKGGGFLRWDLRIDVAHNWTNPITPLWMMDFPAGVEVLRQLRRRSLGGRGATGDPVTLEAYRKIVSRAKLPRFSRNGPICAAIFNKNCQTARYEWSSSARKLLKL